MGMATSEMEKRIQQIRDFAAGNVISYNVMIDILEDKNPPLEDGQIAQIISELAADGITILSADEPAYAAEESDAPESFVPANVQIG